MGEDAIYETVDDKPVLEEFYVTDLVIIKCTKKATSNKNPIVEDIQSKNE